ncbi:MAG: ribosome silencing factor [Phascolarctobacterium sp.]|nr:ribosome silencing factor [Phascolarctobacterium sp.]
MDTKELAKKMAKFADDKKAKDILLLNMEGLSPVTDYYVICSASNTTQVRTIADNIEDELAKLEIFVDHKEGYQDSHWVLLDYGDVVAHIFLEEERDFYNLEHLWADAPSEAFVEEN